MTTTDRSAPTLEAVAERAGVSRSTVSRVVNGSPKVTPDAKAAVERAIVELGYAPNLAARSLASRRSHSIALVIPEATGRFFADPYFASVVEGVAGHLAKSPYTLTLLVGSETDPGRTASYLRGGAVDGALILSTHRDDRSYVELAGRLPIVFSGRPSSPLGGDVVVVDVDNAAASRTATEYLLEHGRRRIATIAGPQDMAAGVDRLSGWRDAILAAGLEPGPIEIGDFTPEGGRAAAARLLERGEAFDGLFVASAQMASGALGALRAHGREVPRDVSVVTIDNDRFAAEADPPLTTMEQPTTAQGAKIAELVVRLIEGRPVDRVTILPTRLIERDSV
jgi:LacI family transcriptional regulator